MTEREETVINDAAWWEGGYLGLHIFGTGRYEKIHSLRELVKLCTDLEGDQER